MTTKADLLNMLADQNCGLNISKLEYPGILTAIAAVERNNPTDRPLASAALNGDWRLLFTTSASLLNLGKLPLSQLRDIYQCIRVENSSIYNIAEIQSLPYLSSLVSVVAKFQPVSEQRVQVNFVRSIAGLQHFLKYQSPATFIEKISSGSKFMPIDFPINSNNPNSWLDITYLDDNLRISRGNQGSVFVLTKD